MLEIDRKRIARIREHGKPAAVPRDPTDFERGIGLFPELKRAIREEDHRRVRYLESRIDGLFG